MTTTATHRPSTATRRVGYVFGILAGAVGLFLINVWPGWEAVPFLTADTAEVLWLVNITLVAGIVANLVYLGYDPPWFAALGNVVTTTVGLVAAVRLLQVFPVDFSGMSVDLTVLVRVVLIVAVVGAAIGIVVNLVTFGRSLPAAGGRRSGSQ
jgi:uncharacterized membrane protein YeaQ/YmgE (transglycosylase-associated protein family)